MNHKRGLARFRARKNAATPQATSMRHEKPHTGSHPTVKTSVSASAVQMPPPMIGS